MTDDVLQFRYTLPRYAADDPSLVEYFERESRQQFGVALFDWLKEHRGGVIGPINVSEERRQDWFDSGMSTTTVTMYVNVSTLPDPPEFKMMGGPADGVIVRTDGRPIWRVPLAPPMPTVASYGEDPSAWRQMYAEYERMGGTQAYRFVGVRP